MPDHTSADVLTVPCAGFWRRVAAFLVDGVVLGLVGYALGLLLFDAFVRMGPWGRCVGFGVALAYFVAQESGRGGGQSLGKRLLGIRVVDAQGRALSPLRGGVRFAVFGVPYFLSGAVLPMTVRTVALGVPVAVLATGGLPALAYLLVFNRRTRQSLHDLAVGAFVVRVRRLARAAREAPGPARTWVVHLRVAAALVVLAGVFPFIPPRLSRLPSFAGLRLVEERLEAQPELRTVGVSVGATRGHGGGEADGRELLIAATIARPLDDNVPLSTRLAGIALASYPDAAMLDTIDVRLAHGYDIGIASSWTPQELALTPAQWADRVAAGVAN